MVSNVNVLVGNDDGWAEANLRAFYQTLQASGYNNTVASCPVVNWSGSGSTDLPPVPLLYPGQYDSVPVGAPATGFNISDPRLNYVNSFPVTAIKHGLSVVSPKFFGGKKPDIVVTGPNVGLNLGLATQFSGTVGAATEAVRQGIPAIAFSGRSGTPHSYTTLTPGDESYVYAELATKLLQALTRNGNKPYLPANVGLNVNFPAVSSECSTAGAFTFVLTRIYADLNPFAKDVYHCGKDRLPTESSVIDQPGCKATISGFTTSKLDIRQADQAVILDKLSSIITCL